MSRGMLGLSMALSLLNSPGNLPLASPTRRRPVKRISLPPDETLYDWHVIFRTRAGLIKRRYAGLNRVTMIKTINAEFPDARNLRVKTQRRTPE